MKSPIVKPQRSGNACFTAQSASAIKRPLVSVIMPAYMAGDTLARSITSVQNQTCENWELLIVDDASDDHSIEIAQGFTKSDSRMQIIGLTRNRGAAWARNKAIEVAQGRYIAFLDADDEWLPEKLARQTEFMKARNAGFSFTGFYRQKSGKRRAVSVPDRIDYKGLLRGNIIGCLTAIYDRKVFGTRFMPEIRMRQDYALWLELLKECDYAHGLADCLAIHHIRRGSLSANKWQAIGATWNMYRKLEGNSPPLATWYLMHHLAQRLRS